MYGDTNLNSGPLLVTLAANWNQTNLYIKMYRFAMNLLKFEDFFIAMIRNLESPRSTDLNDVLIINQTMLFSCQIHFIEYNISVNYYQAKETLMELK